MESVTEFWIIGQNECGAVLGDHVGLTELRYENDSEILVALYPTLFSFSPRVNNNILGYVRILGNSCLAGAKPSSSPGLSTVRVSERPPKFRSFDNLATWGALCCR